MSDLDFSCCGLINGACSRQIQYDIEKHDKMIYQQGYADAIDEFVKLVDNESYHEDCYGDYPSSNMVVSWEDILKVAEQLKEKKNECICNNE